MKLLKLNNFGLFLRLIRIGMFVVDVELSLCLLFIDWRMWFGYILLCEMVIISWGVMLMGRKSLLLRVRRIV